MHAPNNHGEAPLFIAVAGTGVHRKEEEAAQHNKPNLFPSSPYLLHGGSFLLLIKIEEEMEVSVSLC